MNTYVDIYDVLCKYLENLKTANRMHHISLSLLSVSINPYDILVSLFIETTSKETVEKEEIRKNI